MFYANETGASGVTVFYLHGGAYQMDFTRHHWKLDEDPSNELIVGEEMNHVYPLFPIPEAEDAVDRIIQVITRQTGL